MRRFRSGAAPLLCSTLAAGLLAVSPLRAQCGPEGGCTDNPPTVSFRDPVYTGTGTSYSLSVDYSDDFALNAGSRTIKLTNSAGTDVVVVQGNPTGTLHTPTGRTAWSTDWITLAPGSNKITVSISDGIGQTTSRYITVTCNAPPAPIQYDTPRISLAPLHQGFRDVTQSSSTLSYATPSYVSLDQPRSVTLAYASGQVAPVGIVQVDASDFSTSAVSKMSIRVKSSSGAWVTDELFFAAQSQKTFRLAAGWSMLGQGTGTYAYTVEVRTYYADGTVRVSHAPVRVVIVSEQQSRIGAGWAVVGWQHLFGVPAGGPDGITLTDGTGTGLFFEKVCNPSCHYVSPAGDYTTLTANTDGTFTRSALDGSRVVFASNGLIADAYDPYDNHAVFRWRWTSESTPYPVPDTLVDPAGKRTVFAYSDGVHLSGITDPAGRTTVLSRASNGTDLQSIAAPGGSVALSVSYDANHRVTQWQDHGQAWTYGYDGNGFVASLTSPSVFAAGSTRQLTTTVRTLEASVLKGVNSSTATSLARLVPDSIYLATVDAHGDSTRLQVDSWGQPTLVVDPAGRQTIIRRDPANGLPTSIQTPTGARTEMTWDSQTGALTSRDDWIANINTGSTSYVYTSACPAQPRKVSSNSTATWYTLGTRCEVRAVRDDSVGGNPTLYTYDARYRVVTATDSVKQIGTRIARDHNAWLNTDTVTLTSPSNPPQVTRVAYDAYGRTSSTTNTLGETSSVAYDVLNRVTSTTDASLHVARTYWGAADVDSIVDAAGKRYSWTRNALGWVTRESQPAGVRKYGYDEKGRATSATTRDTTKTIAYAFDNLDRVTSRTTPDVGTTTYTYDPAGLWQVVANAESRDSLQMDEAGRVTSVTSTMGGSTYTQRYWYRPDMQMDSLSLLAAGSTYTQRFGYTPAARLQTIGGFGSTVPTSIAYDSAARPKTITYPGGVVQTLAYNNHSLLYTSTYTRGYNTLWNLGGVYGYDELNRVNQRFSIARDTSRSYGYDPVGQLVRYDDYHYWTEQVCTGSEANEVCTNEPRAANYNSRTFTYDAVGNRTDGATLQANSNRYATFNGFTLAYDADGNLTSKTSAGGSAQTFYWNSLDQLDSVRTGFNVTRYGYNGLGMRVRTTTSSGTTRSLYDAMGNLATELSGTGSPLRLYSYYPSVDAPSSMYNVVNATAYYYSTEAPGHVQGLFDGAGNVVNTYRYTPFGDMEAGSPQETVTNPLRYMSREMDASTGLYYVRARWYDAALARFVSEDPIGLDGGINDYAFAGNDPVNATDPSGLRPCTNTTGICLDNVTAYGRPWWYWVLYAGHGTAIPGVGSIGVIRPWDVPGGPPQTNWDRMLALAEATKDKVASTVHAHPCATARIMAGVTIFGDVMFFTGVGAGLRAMEVVGNGLMENGMRFSGAFVEEGIPYVQQGFATAESANSARGLVTVGLQKLPRIRAGVQAAKVVSGRKSILEGVGRFVPGIASGLAVRDAIRACQ
jgi:RHS repeat-associated protein